MSFWSKTQQTMSCIQLFLRYSNSSLHVDTKQKKVFWNIWIFKQVMAFFLKWSSASLNNVQRCTACNVFFTITIVYDPKGNGFPTFWIFKTVISRLYSVKNWKSPCCGVNRVWETHWCALNCTIFIVHQGTERVHE